jgi:hypothetical protein
LNANARTVLAGFTHCDNSDVNRGKAGVWFFRADNLQKLIRTLENENSRRTRNRNAILQCHIRVKDLDIGHWNLNLNLNWNWRETEADEFSMPAIENGRAFSCAALLLQMS